MFQAPFIEYASASLSEDATYTVELLIERVRDEFDEHYWDDWSERGDARRKPAYKPSFAREHVAPAATELSKLTWLSFQRLGSERPVRDLTALKYLPSLTGLALNHNDLTDISAVSACTRLRRLSLDRNQIRDLSPVAKCLDLEELDTSDNPITDLSVLESLPKLRSLTISGNQLPALRKLTRLPALRELEIHMVSHDLSEDLHLPEMPELRVIRGAEVRSLAGLERFPKLESLENVSGPVTSLEPLRSLRQLTHLNLHETKVTNLEPLSGLPELRSLWMQVDMGEMDLAPLKLVPKLHDVTIRCGEVDHRGLPELRKQLSSWDTEFLSKTPRYTPSLEVEVVTQEVFDHYDTKAPYGMKRTDTNHQLVESELEWLEDKLEGAMSPDFKPDDDYMSPFQWGGARSRTVVLQSERSVLRLPQFATIMQKVLCHANNDWIIYLQTEDSDLIAWIYPHKIVTTEEFAERIRTLLGQP